MTSGAVRALLEDLRKRDVRLEADGLSLHVDAPTGVLAEEDKQNLVQNKARLLKFLHWERKRLEEANRRGLVSPVGQRARLDLPARAHYRRMAPG